LLSESEDEFHTNIINSKIQHTKDRLNELKKLLNRLSESEKNTRMFDTLDEYDGVMEEDPHYEVVIRNPNQVKSIDNLGVYSITDNNIYYKIESYDDLLKQVKENREVLLNDIGEFNNSNDLINYLLQLEDIPE